MVQCLVTDASKRTSISTLCCGLWVGSSTVDATDRALMSLAEAWPMPRGFGLSYKADNCCQVTHAVQGVSPWTGYSVQTLSCYQAQQYLQ